MINKTALEFTACLVASFAAISSVHAQEPVSEEAIDFFKQECASCHTIGGGPLTGPDLAGATERQEEEWLVDFILDPKAVIDSGDPYAAKLLRDARGVYMTRVPGIDRELGRKLVRLIAAESAKEKSQFAGLEISDRPLTAVDVELGEKLFRGAMPYVNGAPACISCHALEGLGGLGGGRLGPDLTSAYARLEGRRALAAWLGSPPSAVMQPVFRDHPLDAEEILALVAYMQETAQSGVLEASSRTLEFLLAGLGTTVLLLILFDLVWRRRFRAVRRPLVTRRRQSVAVSHNS